MELTKALKKSLFLSLQEFAELKKNNELDGMSIYWDKDDNEFVIDTEIKNGYLILEEWEIFENWYPDNINDIIDYINLAEVRLNNYIDNEK